MFFPETNSMYPARHGDHGYEISVDGTAATVPFRKIPGFPPAVTWRQRSRENMGEVFTEWLVSVIDGSVCASQGP